MRLFALAVSALTVFAQPTVVAIKNAASWGDVMAPGCWIVIGGSGLAPGVATATTVPLPKSLNGVSVTVGGKDAPLLYVSGTQINALVPFEVGAWPETPVVVKTPEGASAPFRIDVSRNAPALFTRDSSGGGRAHAFDAGFRAVETVSPGDILVLYATGLGPTWPAPESSFAGGAGAEPFNRVADAVEVFVGEQKADVLFAGLAPGFPGVYQVNIRVPAAATLWTDRVYVRVGGWASNVATVGIRQRVNATDVKAEFEETILDSTRLTFRFIGAAVRVQFRLAPTAEPFLVAAVGESGGGWFAKVNPGSRMYEVYATVPSDFAIGGNFSVFGYVYLYSQGACLPMPNGMVPRSLFDPKYMSFHQNRLASLRVGYRDLLGAASEAVGSLPQGTDLFTLSGAFGDYLRTPCGIPDSRKTSFSIYVDGKAVAMQEASGSF